MRLPYLQVTQETWGKARMLGALLGITKRESFGLICDLWAWALELGPADEPPTGELVSDKGTDMLEGALEWTGTRGQLLFALVEVGLVDVEPEPMSIRVRGLDRYAAVWTNAKGRSDAARHAANARWCRSDAERMPDASTPHASGICGTDAPAMRRDAKTQTQTQTHKQQPHSPARAKAVVLSASADSDGVSLRDRLEKVFSDARGSPYSWTHKDESAVGLLLGKPGGTWDEICRRFGIGLARARFPICHTVAALEQHWNAYATDDPSNGKKPRDITRGTTRAEDFAGTYGPAGEADF